MTRAQTLFAIFFIGLLATACGQTTSTVNTPEQPHTPSNAACPNGAVVTEVLGEIIDEAQEGIHQAMLTACVTDLEGTASCLRPVLSDASGQFRIRVPAHNQCAKAIELAVLPAMADVASMTSLNCELHLDPHSPVVNAPAMTLYRTKASTFSQTTTSDQWELQPNTQLQLSNVTRLNAHDTIGVRMFQPQPGDLCFLSKPEEFGPLFGFSPETALYYPKDETSHAALRLPYEGTKPIGSRVTMYLLGTMACHKKDKSLYPPRWTPFGHAMVKQAPQGTAGRVLELTPETQLPCLTWIGYRKD